ncbi:helix-turn-helix domain-containing protein [Roseimicrobium sp. ORNL1]|uniref:helix-turn-helix domain-containing protein n=1 Tax=Roseimicrobium sp. ORNL1 TaxID=2711231 RepID=UPI0013E11506|nr:helix-turn-helix domain-containing protein [Roseimicrobium sp. ORNL1]QIF05188.1 hypothetical protein G5S37_27970 [Roseimicrobium sp. ORNL1]
MSLEAINAVLKHSKAKGSTRLVLVILAHHGNKDQGHKSWPSVATIAEEANITERHAKRILRELNEELKELYISFETGISRTNEYWPLLPGLSTPAIVKGGDTGDTLSPANARSTSARTSVQQPFVAPANEALASASPCQALAKHLPTPSKGDAGGTEGVTCRAAGGDGHDTQTLSETEKKNLNIPLNPPEGEGEVCDFDFWRENLNEAFGLPRNYRDSRIKRLRFKYVPQDQSAWPMLEKYLKAPAPQREDWEEQASLLRCRRKNAVSCLRYLPEMLANAQRWYALRYPKKEEPPKNPFMREPEGDWRRVALGMYVTGDPRWVDSDARAKEICEHWPWQNIPLSNQREIARACREKKEGGNSLDQRS